MAKRGLIHVLVRLKYNEICCLGLKTAGLIK